MAVKDKNDVFIHIVKANELANKEFTENGEISFFLTKGGFKKLKKLIDLETNYFGANRKKSVNGKITFFLNGLRWVMKSMYYAIFDMHLENINHFYLTHKHEIKEIQEHEYSENKRCTVVTFIRKKNPSVSHLSVVENDP